jgi:hypothetical protein
MSDWTEIEVTAIVHDYMDMLVYELSGKPFNKASHRRNLMKIIQREDGSIEFKHQNISAVLVKLGLPYINGYKPLPNYQKLLEKEIMLFLEARKSFLEPYFKNFAESDDHKLISTTEFGNILTAPPTNNKGESTVSENLEEYGNRLRKPFKINYLEREQYNARLGLAGEQLVIAYEKWSLQNAGKSNLADKTEWIAEHDDGAGFDILSKYENGKDKFIEVKTTKLSKDAPIFFSRNEYEFAKNNRERFHLYRLYQFSKKPRMFMLPGGYDDFCKKETIQYRGSF